MNKNFNSGNLTSGKNISPWIASIDPIKYNPLSENISADVVIVGGGISGISTAYFLASAGLRVAVVEDGFIGSGETGRTTAHLVNVLDDRYSELINLFGEEKTKLAAESHTEAINRIELVAQSENIDCSFERLSGYLFLHEKDNKTDLVKEFNSCAKAGLSAELVDSAPGIVDLRNPIIRFNRQAQFHPLKYINGLCKSIIKKGGKIFTETHVDSVNKNGVETKNGIINAGHIVIATNTPVTNRFVIHTKQAPYRTYVIGSKIKKGTLEKALWWDTGNPESTWPIQPYHYARIFNFENDNDLLIVGGEDHKTGQADAENIFEKDRYNELELWMKRHFPQPGEVIFNWSGQVMEPVDSLAFIGRNPQDDENIYIATGDSGNGMTHGTIAGILLTDLILGKKNAWAEIYDPSRINLKSTDVFIEEQVNVVKQYADYIKGDETDSLNNLSKDSGIVITKDGKKTAVYRDENNDLHFSSAVCPHLKCIVQWNDDEKSFDCPCHGSRFTGNGKVINGPANTDLEKIKEK
jgi:glycine/D-amino acid oxidase-like deaminating enzyme/nitrite reductase/ring-hydroxylating ferredoxin subunit